MGFSEDVKKQVKERAAFRCCRCQNVGVQVHHILPEGEDGPNTVENAAPLCPSCHDYFGANPMKRKEIKHMRDWWYERVKQMYSNGLVSPEEVRQIHSKLEDIQQGQTSGLGDLKKMMSFISKRMIDRMTTETADATARGIVNTSAAISGVQQGGPNPTVEQGTPCPNCGNGRMYFERWGPSARGFFTAWYKCSDCECQLTGYETFGD